MLNRFATLAAVSMLFPVATAPLASADPGDDGPPPDNGIVASADPGIVTTPDGWTLTVLAKDESELPIAPLTTSAASREYLVAGTFTGTITGSGKTKLAGGTLEAGYQIGCGIELGQVRLVGQAGVTLGGLSGSPTGLVFAPALSFPLSGTIEIHPKPGTVTTVTVDKKSFKAAPVRVTLQDTHIKVDGCVGQSFLRSYATLTSSTTDTDDVVAYYGVTKAV
jgi:MspA